MALRELLKSGWKPERTIVFGSWDAEEEGLIGSTEWGEEHEKDLAHAVAYFNLDVAVTGTNFGASAVPSLKGFVRDVTKVVPSPKGGMLYNVWKDEKTETAGSAGPTANQGRTPNARWKMMSRSAIWAADQTTAFSSSIWAFLPLT